MSEMRLIEANALKVHMCNMCDDGERECKGDESCALLVWVNDMPTIDAVPVRYGRWIFVGEETMHDGWTYRKYKCSECDFVTVEAKNFCQNCGVKMGEVLSDADRG